MRLNYSEQGSGSAVILIHGMFGSLSNLGGLARQLASRCRVVSVDLRNHGDSPHDPFMDIPCMAKDIIELMDALNLQSTILIGHSLGGKVAMQVALNFASRVSKVVVADISPVAYNARQDSALDALEAVSKVVLNSRSQADKIAAQYVSDAQTRAFLLKNIVRADDGIYRLRLNIESILEYYSSTLVAAPEGVSYHGPSLFLKGEVSAYIQTKHRPIMQNLFPNHDLQIMSGVGHWLHAENPEDFNRRVAEFLDIR
ncbi:MAG: alpha/beta fold hydrolase [Porticoccaceae bacterium]|nr:alpha/beta fold hydrolase [Porticoccaceae bacterium]MDG1473881.1 alpha/beta fold hydrolase [Porticoccaceae bacterium]